MSRGSAAALDTTASKAVWRSMSCACVIEKASYVLAPMRLPLPSGGALAGSAAVWVPICCRSGLSVADRPHAAAGARGGGSYAPPRWSSVGPAGIAP